MNTGSRCSVDKPISAWNRPLKANFKDRFKALGKGVIDGAVGKWEGVAGALVEASVAVGLAADPGQMAWLLMARALDRAITRLSTTPKFSSTSSNFAPFYELKAFIFVG